MLECALQVDMMATSGVLLLRLLLLLHLQVKSFKTLYISTMSLDMYCLDMLTRALEEFSS